MSSLPESEALPAVADDRAALGVATGVALRFSVFAAGAILMALEILAFRVIGKTFGLALRETSVVISVFLAAMSVGYFLGGRWGDRRPRVRTLAVVLAAAGATALAIPTLDAALSPRIFASALPLSLHAAVVTVALFFVPTLCLASVSPIAVRLLAGGAESSGSVAGGVAALSTVGSIAGSVAGAFVLIDLFESVSWTIRLLALAAVFLAGALAAVRLHDARALGGGPARWLARHRFAVGASAALAAALLVHAGLDAWASPFELRADPRFRLGEVVYERDSAFNRITVVDRERTRSLYFKYAETQSTMSLDDPYAGAAEYTDYFHIPMALADDVKSALFLGLGGGSVPKRYEHDYPGVVVDVVELDPAVVDVARRFFALETGPRLRVTNMDGRAFVKRSRERWDVIGIDAYSTNAYGSTMPAHMATREFLAEVAERLTPDGYLVMNVAAPAHSPISRALVRTMKEVFPRPMLFGGTTGNTILVAGRQEHFWKREEVEARVAAALASGAIRIASLPELASRMMTSSLPLGDAQVLTDDYAPVDTLMRQSRPWGTAAGQ